ncbi:hypothetical protein PLESTM_000168400 [Pleodorina starrii]|nr:hypothetical protein PLESTM_000168400 [Pleodorina starrii]
METALPAMLVFVVVAAVAPLVYLLHQMLWPFLSCLPLRRKLRQVPGPPGHFLLGHIFDLIANPVHQQLAKWTEEYGPIYKIGLPGAMAVILTEPEAVATVIKVERYDKSAMTYKFMEKITRDTHPNIVTVPTASYHRAIRKAVTPAFSTANLRRFFPELVVLTERLVQQLLTHGSFASLDMDLAAQRLTVDVIGRFAFDRNFNALSSGRSEALEAVGKLMVSLQRDHNPLNRWFWWRKETREFWADRVRFDAIVRRALEDLRERPPAPHCLLSHLLSFTDPNTGKALSGKALRAETATFWIAGFETTAHAIAWALMFIASDEQVEARIAAELDACGLLATPARPEPRPVAWGDLGALRFLNAVIQEALRLMPPAGGGTVRTVPRDTKLAGYDVPAGTVVWIPFYALQRSKGVWGPDANEFRPDRWLAPQGLGPAQDQAPQGPNDDNGGGSGCGGAASSNGAAAGAAAPEEDEVVKAAATASARGWIPFSEGPRNCVGQSLALLELRTVLAVLCGRFRFQLADEMGGVEGVVAASRQETTLKPGEKGLLMHAIPRVAT